MLGLRRFGVPPGGPFDAESHGLANDLLGNEAGAPCLEMAMAAARLIALAPVEIGLAGAICDLEVDGVPVPMQSAIFLREGQELRIAPPTIGARIYLSMPGGIVCENLRRGGRVSSGLLKQNPARRIATSDAPHSVLPGRALRVIPFGEPAAVARLVACQELIVKLDSDRVGIRLDGIRLDPGPEKLSEPACPGAIQVTNDGGVIVLGPDGPTIGGYRKIGLICAADFSALGQLRPGAQARFEEITREEAITAWKERTLTA